MSSGDIDVVAEGVAIKRRPVATSPGGSIRTAVRVPPDRNNLFMNGIAGRSLRDALATARRSVVRLSQETRRAGFEANEETLTQLLLARAHPGATPTVFTRREENRYTGADWLWWFTDQVEWFGVLVQAKRAHIRPDGVTYGFDYEPRPSPSDPHPPTQRQRLLEASRSLDVPAVYALYNSDRLPRALVADHCCDPPWSAWERPWRRLGVAWVPAMIVDYHARLGDGIEKSMRPLECVGCPRNLSSMGLPLATSFAGDAWRSIASLFTDPSPSLSRRVATMLIDQMLQTRMLQLRSAEGVSARFVADDALSRVFPVVPDDVGHFNEPYFEHVLRGLRSRPPTYVEALLEGVQLEEIGADLETVTGVTIVAEVSS